MKYLIIGDYVYARVEERLPNPADLDDEPTKEEEAEKVVQDGDRLSTPNGGRRRKRPR